MQRTVSGSSIRIQESMSQLIQRFQFLGVPFAGRLGEAITATSYGLHTLRITGSTSTNPDGRFSISLQSGSSIDSAEDVMLNITVRLDTKEIVFNSYYIGEPDKTVPKIVDPGEKFEIVILCELSQYKIYLNGAPIHRYQHRHPPEYVSHIVITGDVILTKVEREYPYVHVRSLNQEQQEQQLMTNQSDM